MLKKNHIGRPSNEELKRRKNKKVLMYGLPIIVIITIIGLIVTSSLSRLMNDSITTYYCGNSEYPNLEGTTCYKWLTKKASLYADINLDDKVDNNDLNLLYSYVKNPSSVNLSGFQIKLADINEDGAVNESDVQMLENYFTGSTGTVSNYIEIIGQKRICEDEYIQDGDTCKKKESIPADKKVYNTVDSSQKTTNTNTKTNNTTNTNNTADKPVIVTFKPDDNSTELKVNRKYNLNVIFDVKDSSKNYYYIWDNYLYGEKNYSTACTKVVNGEHHGAFTIIGKRKAVVTIYSDASCKNQVSQTESKTYTCSGCTNMVDVSFKPQDDKTVAKNGTKYKLNVNFNINDKENTYYYIWRAYLNGTKNYETKCTEVVQGEHDGSINVNGKRMVSVAVYSDSQCMNKIKTVNSETYSSINTFKVNYDSNGGKGSMNSQNITYGVSTNLSANKFVKNNYYFIGWRVYNNSINKWMCYTDKNKSSMNYTDTNNCKANGYVIYKDKQKISKTASTGETITMKALWQYSYSDDKVSFKGFEKSVKGATVWTMVKQNLYKNSNGTSVISVVPQGVALKAIDMTNGNNENKSYVKVKFGNNVGYIDGWITMINLPDVIPSAIYNITNASSSIFASRSHKLNGVTGYDIYGNNWLSNMAPIRIETAKKIQKAASLAISHGNRIKIYDSFRPWSVQRKIADAVNANWFTGKTYNITSDFNKDRNRNTNGIGVTSIVDSKGWFIAIASQNLGSHNLARAIDVSLVTIDDNQDVPTQSKMHELSGESVPTKNGVDNNKAELSLHNLFMDAGFYFLPSEWWHFEDKNNVNYSKYYNELKCLGSPSSAYGCGINQIKLAE